jgi:hypothetical protein
MTEERPQQPAPEKRGGHNEIGYRDTDEEGEFDERGSQGTGPGEPDPDENDSDENDPDQNDRG